MIPKEQWLTLHRICLDAVRSVIKDMPDDEMSAQPAPSGDLIGDQLSHIIGCECYWLTEVGIEPRFGPLQREDWTASGFLDEFDKIERQYEDILEEKGLDADVLFGLGRVCQHALYHFVRVIEIRRVLKPEWEPAEEARWERAADFITDLLIVGAEAKPMYD